MIVEQRTYQLQIGKVPEYLALYEAEGLAVQRRHLGRLVGYFSTEIGGLHKIIHMWAYKDLNERAERRARLAADPAWQAYIAQSSKLQISQANEILLPTSFSPWFEDDPSADMAVVE